MLRHSVLFFCTWPAHAYRAFTCRLQPKTTSRQLGGTTSETTVQRVATTCLPVCICVQRNKTFLLYRFALLGRPLYHACFTGSRLLPSNTQPWRFFTTGPRCKDICTSSRNKYRTCSEVCLHLAVEQCARPPCHTAALRPGEQCVSKIPTQMAKTPVDH